MCDTEIAGYAFEDCFHLKHIVVPGGTLQKYSSMLINGGKEKRLIEKIVEG